MKKLVLAGLDGSGKTSLARFLVTGIASEHAPTARIRIDKLLIGNTPIELVDSSGDADLAGGRKWVEHTDADGFVFIIDGTDRARLPEVEKELKRLFIRKKPIAILLNKSDLVTFCPVTELTQALNLEQCIAETLPPLQAFECSIAKGLGFKEALQWVISVS